MGRTLKTDIPVVENQLNVKDSKAVVAWKTKKKEIQKAYHDREAKPLPPLKQGEMVRIYDQKKLMWGEKATVKEKIAIRSYIVETKDKVQYRRNRKQLRKITSEVEDGNDKNVSTTKRAEKQVETKLVPSNEVSRDRSRYGLKIPKGGILLTTNNPPETDRLDRCVIQLDYNFHVTAKIDPDLPGTILKFVSDSLLDLDQLPLWARLQQAIQAKLQEGDVSYTLDQALGRSTDEPETKYVAERSVVELSCDNIKALQDIVEKIKEKISDISAQEYTKIDINAEELQNLFEIVGSYRPTKLKERVMTTIPRKKREFIEGIKSGMRLAKRRYKENNHEESEEDSDEVSDEDMFTPPIGFETIFSVFCTEK
ncbi:Hypothetical predicted protein [Paramuricea clavata]|uniref:Uncharacterized protein n=1 Tax=Paramuricea clavata TaxID=317549 RepID=A0A6S7H5G8_PARCT|nr:Hypothetical predicted protein [Paramuricea clavata]